MSTVLERVRAATDTARGKGASAVCIPVEDMRALLAVAEAAERFCQSGFKQDEMALMEAVAKVVAHREEVGDE